MHRNVHAIYVSTLINGISLGPGVLIIPREAISVFITVVTLLLGHEVFIADGTY